MTECRHDSSQWSTLSISYTTASGPGGYPTYLFWICTCKVCGKYTEPCLTEAEAKKRGIIEWWMEVGA